MSIFTELKEGVIAMAYVPKPNCKRLVDITKLECKVYRNFGEVCRALGWSKPINDEQKKQDWKRLQHYCDIKKIECSNKVEILEIYDEVK